VRWPALRWGLTPRTVLASGLLAAIVGGVFALLLVAVIDQRGLRAQALDSRAQLASADALLALIIDMETGQRGFVMTRTERFLEPWTAARAALPARARDLARAAEDPAQARRAWGIAVAVTSYIQDYSEPLVSAARRGERSSRSVASIAEGKRRADSLRAQVAQFRESERDLVAARQNEVDDVGQRAIVLSTAGLVGSVLVILLFSVYLVRGIGRPVRRAAVMADRLAGGDLSVRMAEIGPAEVGDLERAFNTMAGSLETSRAELTASRARVIAAADQSRRRIERDLHDGAQQRLVSLALELREAEGMVSNEQHELKERLAKVADGMVGALEDLQEISRGIHPAILSEGGLVAALKTLARRSALPVELALTLDRRLPEPVEIAAYYVASEALANAAKHAQASVIHIDLKERDGFARLAIRDDGVGGADPSHGSGLTGLADRVQAMGGTIEVTSPAGGGTALVVELPVEGS
jgi:signal transduction histidine kinase